MLEPKTIDDLIPHPRNPRKQSDKSASGLRESMKRYGNIAGITWNKRTGRLVCGHQRVKQLRELGGQVIDGAIQIKNGKRFAIEVVDMTEAEELEANVAANNRHIAGEFTEDIEFLLPEIQESLGDESFQELNFGFLYSDLPAKHIDENEEWEDFPEFEQPDAMAFRTIRVHFQNQEHVNKFCKLIAAEITEKTKYIWWPEIQKNKTADKRIVSDES